MTEPAPLLVFSDDWGRHPSSCQHLIMQLLPRRQVVWVNTIGTRPPRLDLATLRRGMEKMVHWFGGLGSRRSPVDLAFSSTFEKRGEDSGVHRDRGLSVRNPIMWPSFRSRLGRGMNRRLLTRAIQPIIASLPHPPIVITTLPITADLVGCFPARRWVYYCVDDFGVWPGLDGRTLRSMEAELVTKVDTVIAVSETLQSHIAHLGKPAKLLTHGVDLDHWRTPASNILPESLRDVPSLTKPLIVFWGVIDRRMDLAFVRHLSDRFERGTILLVGPQDSPNPELLQLPHVKSLPPIPYADLPALATKADVLIMPYINEPVSQAMQPLKLKEYLATGKPCIVRRLPSTEPWADCLDLADNPEQFAEAVMASCRTGVTAEQMAARARLEREGWGAKAELFEGWIE